ncbi:energy transducer TonB [Kiritimatiella glycovorans]|nr:energy transducer TonB [Kiritimatiella glycovorans]
MWTKMLRPLLLVAGALLITLAYFMILPVLQTIGQMQQDDMELRTVQTAQLEPPPPPPPEPEQEEPPEEPEPELQQESQPLDLSQLELALNPGMGGDWGGDFAVNLDLGSAQKAEMDAIFSMAQLDQRPRVLYQPAPRYPPDLRSKGVEGTVYVIFVVNTSGRVEQARVQKSTHPAFEEPALKAVKKWKFEPGKRKGKPVRFRMRVPISFAAG